MESQRGQPKKRGRNGRKRWSDGGRKTQMKEVIDFKKMILEERADVNDEVEGGGLKTAGGQERSERQYTGISSKMK